MKGHCELFTCRLDSLDDYLEIIDVSPPNDRTFFRGQSEADWLITSTYYRSYHHGVLPSLVDNFEDLVSKHHPPTHDYLNIHNKCIEHFIEKTELPQEFLDFHSGLTVAQHYGVPTNLIDFSFSSDVALFFAFNDARPNAYSDFVAMYAIKPMGLLNYLAQTCVAHGAEEKWAYNEVQTVRKTDSSLKFHKPSLVSLALNKRITQQQGTFIYWPDNVPFDVMVYRLETDGFLGTDHKYLIPKKYKEEAMCYLASKGITYETLLNDQHIWKMEENEWRKSLTEPNATWVKEHWIGNHIQETFDDPFLDNGNKFVGMDKEQATNFDNKFFEDIQDSNVETLYDKLQPAAQSASLFLENTLKKR